MGRQTEKWTVRLTDELGDASVPLPPADLIFSEDLGQLVLSGSQKQTQRPRKPCRARGSWFTFCLAISLSSGLLHPTQPALSTVLRGPKMLAAGCQSGPWDLCPDSGTQTAPRGSWALTSCGSFLLGRYQTILCHFPNELCMETFSFTASLLMHINRWCARPHLIH